MQPLKIYIAGPLSADTKEIVFANCQRAVDAGIELMRKGHFPFVPHLSLWTNTRAKVKHDVEFTWEQWMKLDDAFLQCCDALLYLGSSRGADQELARAKELGLQIFYSVDEVPEVEVEE
jgi:hypothetical protein